jgi:hypothetical protein
MAGINGGTAWQGTPVSTRVVEGDGDRDRQAMAIRIEAFALAGVRTLGFLGIPFATLLFLFLRLDAWQIVLTWALLLTGSIGLFLCQRWAAVLICGICWFGLATCLFDPFPPRRVGEIPPDELVFITMNGGVALLLTTLPPLCSRRLKNGFWTRPAVNRPAAVFAVLTGIIWLWFHLHAFVEWASEDQARLRICALTLTIGAGLLALLWRRKTRRDL